MHIHQNVFLQIHTISLITLFIVIIQIIINTILFQGAILRKALYIRHDKTIYRNIFL